ncbi:hypothetical protein OK016_14575 [Vibrio chagasii]|nr:hypothetical protein [Vibrio chagasii]
MAHLRCLNLRSSLRNTAFLTFRSQFEDVEAVDRFQNSESGEKPKNAMKRRGLQGLAFWHNGMKQMSANKPLLTLADEGLKFRVQASGRIGSSV